MEQTKIIATGSFAKDPWRGDELPERQIWCTISTGDVDRMNRRVDQAGIDVTAYMRNPVVLWNHNSYLPPIGKTLEVKAVTGQTYALLEYAPEGVSPLADQICALERAGFLPAQSIGWMPTEMPTVNAKTGLVEFSKVELLEWSKVTIPANEHAVNTASAEVRQLEMAREFGLITYEPLIKDLVQQGILKPRPSITTARSLMRRLSVTEVASLILNDKTIC